MLHKQINMVSILLAEMQPMPHSCRGWRETDCHAVCRIFANLDCVNAFRQLPHKPNNHFAEEFEIMCLQSEVNFVPGL